MIRFIEIGDQIQLNADTDETPATDFAFWNTINNTFVSIDGELVFHSVEDFIWIYSNWSSNSDVPLKRLLGVIPDKFFINNPISFYLNEPHHNLPQS